MAKISENHWCPVTSSTWLRLTEIPSDPTLVFEEPCPRAPSLGDGKHVCLVMGFGGQARLWERPDNVPGSFGQNRSVSSTRLRCPGLLWHKAMVWDAAGGAVVSIIGPTARKSFNRHQTGLFSQARQGVHKICDQKIWQHAWMLDLRLKLPNNLKCYEYLFSLNWIYVEGIWLLESEYMKYCSCSVSGRVFKKRLKHLRVKITLPQTS